MTRSRSRGRSSSVATARNSVGEEDDQQGIQDTTIRAKSDALTMLKELKKKWWDLLYEQYNSFIDASAKTIYERRGVGAARDADMFKAVIQGKLADLDPNHPVLDLIKPLNADMVHIC
jgi:hypothetical protein